MKASAIITWLIFALFAWLNGSWVLLALWLVFGSMLTWLVYVQLDTLRLALRAWRMAKISERIVRSGRSL
jgi:hypothetical protein